MIRKLAALAVILAAVVIAQAPAASASAPQAHECWGSNRGDWSAFHQAVPQSHCVRTYYDQIDVFPALWPASAGSAWVMLSIRPSYTALMNGSLNAKIKSLCASAPAHSRLTIYHENAGGNPLNYPPSIHNAAHFVAMQKRIEALCRGTHVRFGVIIIAPFSGVLNWIWKGDDWFGYDFYAFTRYLNRNGTRSPSPFITSSGTINVAAVTARMTANLRALQKFTGRRCPQIALGETNASRDSQRKTWFTTLATWFATHDDHRGWILTRWTAETGPHSGLSGPWPPSAEVVQVLRRLAWVYR